MNHRLWHVPPAFIGATVAVIATGPSLTQGQVDLVKKSRIPVIAVNNGFEYAPWADILYACDRVWWDGIDTSGARRGDGYWEKGRLGGRGARYFRGVKASLEDVPFLEVLRIGNGGTFGFDDRKNHVRTGKNSACQAVHIAAHAGSTRVILLGCDCRVGEGGVTHCHGGHEWRRKHGNPPYECFLEGWNRLAPELAARGIKVINCSPGSAIECFEKMELGKALGIKNS